MVKIRLFRTGTSKRPHYRIVAIEKSRARQGRFLEILGTYDPKGGGTAYLDREGIGRWISKGAQLSDTVRSLMKRPAEETARPALAPRPAAAPAADLEAPPAAQAPPVAEAAVES